MLVHRSKIIIIVLCCCSCCRQFVTQTHECFIITTATISCYYPTQLRIVKPPLCKHIIHDEISYNCLLQYLFTELCFLSNWICNENNNMDLLYTATNRKESTRISRAREISDLSSNCCWHDKARHLQGAKSKAWFHISESYNQRYHINQARCTFHNCSQRC